MRTNEKYKIESPLLAVLKQLTVITMGDPAKVDSTGHLLAVAEVVGDDRTGKVSQGEVQSPHHCAVGI